MSLPVNPKKYLTDNPLFGTLEYTPQPFWIMTLLERQEEALRAMLEPRSSERRAAKHRLAVAKAYIRTAVKLGYTVEQARQQVRDVSDMYWLSRGSDYRLDLEDQDD